MDLDQHMQDRAQNAQRTVVVLINERHPVLEEGANQVNDRDIGRLVRERLQLRPAYGVSHDIKFEY